MVSKSFKSYLREAKREAARRRKELEKLLAEYQKLQALQKAVLEVEIYENYIERILSLHKDCTSDYNWRLIAASAPPATPQRLFPREIEAVAKLRRYRGSPQEKRKLRCAIIKAIVEDKQEYAQLLEKHQQELEEHKQIVAFANRMLQGDLTAYKKVVEELEPLTELSELGTEIEFTFISKTQIVVTLTAHQSKIVPTESKSLLSSGKVSVKKLSSSQFNELYQDYVCSSSLRVAREVFGLLPVAEIILTVKTDLLNKATGQVENQPILSVKFTRDKLGLIDFDRVDPSDAMSNFIHNMGFKKSKGFYPIQELSF